MPPTTMGRKMALAASMRLHSTLHSRMLTPGLAELALELNLNHTQKRVTLSPGEASLPSRWTPRFQGRGDQGHSSGCRLAVSVLSLRPVPLGITAATPPHLPDWL